MITKIENIKIDRGLYMLLNESHLDYSNYTQAIVTLATNFKPRRSLDNSKAIIQIKESYQTKALSWVEDPSVRSAVVLEAGGVEWARALVALDYTLEKGNEWDPPDEDFVET